MVSPVAGARQMRPVHWALMALLVSLGSASLDLARAEEITGLPPPMVELGHHPIVYNHLGQAFVPVSVRGAWETDGLEFIIRYDADLLSFSYDEGGAWNVVGGGDTTGGRGQVKLRWLNPANEGRGDTNAEDEADLEPTVIATLVFSAVRGQDSDPESPFRFSRTSELSLTGTGFFRKGRFQQDVRLPGQFVDGSVTVHYENGFEVGSGNINPTAVEFRLPLYFTYVEQGHPPTHVGGMDYDELLLKSVNWFSPPLENVTGYAPRSEEFPSRARFALEFSQALRGPFARKHVADFVFSYDATGEAGKLIEVKPLRLYSSTAAAAGEGAGGGAGAALNTIDSESSVVGGIGIVKVLNDDPFVFVRGNVTSEAGGIDISAAQAILSFLFLGGDSLPCERAGDINGDHQLSIADAVWLLTSLFGGGHSPVSPYPEPGFEEFSASELPCDKPFPFFAPQRAVVRQAQ